MSEDYGHFPFGYLYYESKSKYEYFVQLFKKPQILDLKPISVDMRKYQISDRIISTDE